LTLDWLIEPLKQRDDGALTGADLTNNCIGGSSRYFEVCASEELQRCLWCCWICEMDVGERDGSFQLEWLLVLATLDLWSSFDDLENGASDFGCPNNLCDLWNDQQDLRKGNDHRNIHSQDFFD